MKKASEGFAGSHLGYDRGFSQDTGLSGKRREWKKAVKGNSS